MEAVDPVAEDPNELLELDETECYDLLRSVPIGRIATAMPGSPPLVVPVTFVVDRRIVVFRTAMGAKIEGLRSGPASFEADSYDPLHHTGWSVLVQGVAYEATPAEVAGLDLEPWAPGERDVWIRLVPGIVTGRRISTGGEGLDWRAYR